MYEIFDYYNVILSWHNWSDICVLIYFINTTVYLRDLAVNCFKYFSHVPHAGRASYREKEYLAEIKRFVGTVRAHARDCDCGTREKERETTRRERNTRRRHDGTDLSRGLER